MVEKSYLDFFLSMITTKLQLPILKVNRLLCENLRLFRVLKTQYFGYGP